MKKYKISVILPSINPSNWIIAYNMVTLSCGKYPCEVIAVGTKLPSQELLNRANFKYLRELGSPSRSLQMAALLAEGDYVTWFPDDCIIEVGALEKCINFMDDKSKKDGMTILYSEGSGYTGTQHLQSEYWIARTHADLRVEEVKEGWKIAPIFLYDLDNFIEIGGLDCRFEHINMNTHSLAFRVQENGGTIHPSPVKVASADWKPWTSFNKSPVQRAYEENDGPLFKKLYGAPCEEKMTTPILYNNWQKADIVWKRRNEI